MFYIDSVKLLKIMWTVSVTWYPGPMDYKTSEPLPLHLIKRKLAEISLELESARMFISRPSGAREKR